MPGHYCKQVYILISLFKFIIPVIISVVSALVIPVVVSLTEIFTVFTTTAGCVVVTVPAVINPVFHKRPVIKFQFTLGDRSQFCLDIIIMHQLFMPVAVSELHIVRDRIRKTLS